MMAVSVPGLARHRDLLQQILAIDREVDVAHLQAAGAGRRFLAAHQHAAGEHQVDVADRDHVALAQQRGPDPHPVDECPVDAVRVADLDARGRRLHERVVARRQHVVDDDVVVERATDPGRAARSPASGRIRALGTFTPRWSRRLGRHVRRRRVGAHARRRLVRRRRGSAAGQLAGSARRLGGLRSVGRAAEVPRRAADDRDRHRRQRQHTDRTLVMADVEDDPRPIGQAEVEALAVPNVDRRHPSAVGEDAVVRVVVDRDPPAVLEAQQQVRAGDQRVRDA